MSWKRGAAAAVGVLLLVGSGCSGDEATEDIERTEVEFSPTETFGFDDFGSPGAALAIAVDEQTNAALLIGLKFELPFYEGEFSPPGDVERSASGWSVAPPNAPLEVAASRYPILLSAITNTAGIRTMSGELTAIFLQGDLGSSSPERIFVADGGSVTLTRKDGPYDVVEGELKLREVTALGSGATEPDEPNGIRLPSFYFEWDTDEQP